MSADAVDRLPPVARFCARGLAAGMTPEDLCRVLRSDAATIAKHVRIGLAALDEPLPPPGGDEDALLAAAAPLIAAASLTAARAPSTACLSDDVAAALAAGALDGPLLLAEAEHAADCAACLGRVATSTSGAAPPAAAERPAESRGVAVTLVCALLVAGLVVWFALYGG